MAIAAPVKEQDVGIQPPGFRMTPMFEALPIRPCKWRSGYVRLGVIWRTDLEVPRRIRIAINYGTGTARRYAEMTSILAADRCGPLFRRVGVVRTKGHPGRRALGIADLSYNAQIDRERMAAISARQASVTYAVGDAALTVAAVRAILRKRALAAADLGLVDLMGEDLKRALDALSTHSLRVGLTQDLFANGEDAGPIAQALRWSSVGTALRYGRRLAPASNAAARMLAGRRG